MNAGSNEKKAILLTEKFKKKQTTMKFINEHETPINSRPLKSIRTCLMNIFFKKLNVNDRTRKKMKMKKQKQNQNNLIYDLRISLRQIYQ